ncbi:MAG: cytochrome B562 [Burkholderiales bacterium]|nr:cytochrome B562 [Burkholderiales bacterium]
MSKLLPRIYLPALLVCAQLVIGAQMTYAGEIKVAMKDMKRALRGAMASTTMPELSRYVAQLERDADQASRQPYRSDQATYDQGMQKLKLQLAAVDEAIRANDMNEAKQDLRKINATRKHYHDLLN